MANPKGPNNLWAMRQQKLAQRQQQPKAPSVPPAAEPIQKAEVPAAPAVPVSAPVAAPAPALVSAPVPAVAPAPAAAPVAEIPAEAAKAKRPSLPPLPMAASLAAPVAKPPSVPPAPAAAPVAPLSEPVEVSPDPAMTGSGSIPVRSGDYDLVGDAPASGPATAPAAMEPAPAIIAPADLPSLAGLLPEEATPEPAPLPREVKLAPKAKPPAAELKRKEFGTLGFRQLSDNGHLPSKYKLTYTGQSGATSCNFLLIGKETQQVTLELGVPRTLTVQTKGGPMSVTLTYAGASKTDGAKEVEYVVEGGVSAVTGIMERFKGFGPAALSAWQSLVKHLPEAISLGFAAGLAVCGFTMDWIGAQLGRFHPYVTAAVPALMAGLAMWTWAERSKHIKRESEKAE
ncbi:hypothetical protein L0Y65_04035 [Candidatus Micrarchaeota archaeon]|nr:hypothetical protein [Candidatus Micrarchaeota archaeon]